MIEALLICFREGLESFLIVSIIAITIQKTNLLWLQSAVRSGVALSVITSIITGIALARVGQLSPFWEGWLAIAAAVAVIWCVVHMMKEGHSIRGMIETRILSNSSKNRVYVWLFVFGLTFFMIAREGIEAATMIASLAAMREAWHMAIGAIIGLMAAIGIMLLWLRYGKRIQLRDFFRITAWMMIIFAAQLLVLAFHEFTEVNAIPYIDNSWWHLKTESVAEGHIGQIMTTLLILLPLGWVILRQLPANILTRIFPAS